MNKFNKLSRAEMKKVTGGQFDGGGGCYEGAACSVYDSDTGNTYSGSCGSGWYTICECISDFGPYNANHYSCQF